MLLILTSIAGLILLKCANDGHDKYDCTHTLSLHMRLRGAGWGSLIKYADEENLMAFPAEIYTIML